MADTSQTRAIKSYRQRLSCRGMARFEVMGLDLDRKLIRAIAKRLADSTGAGEQLRASVNKALGNEAMPEVGGILAALRRSPLVGSGIKLTRPRVKPRKVDL